MGIKRSYNACNCNGVGFNISLEAILLEAYIVAARIYVHGVFTIFVGHGGKGFQVTAVAYIHLTGLFATVASQT
ncbi:hypothetical protein DSECCO2_646640 [anaerobic digester metagenome]